MKLKSSYLFFLLAFLLTASSFAKNLNLYDEPKDNAKVITTVDSNAGIIPIFTPDKSEWMKVADPQNGNVGWVRVKDLGTGNSTEFTFTQRYINTGSSPQSFQMIQVGGPNKMTPDQIQKLMKKNEMEQQQLQQNVNQSLQKMIRDMRNLYPWDPWFTPDMPFIMPVIVVPSNHFSEKPKKTKTKNSTH